MKIKYFILTAFFVFAIQPFIYAEPETKNLSAKAELICRYIQTGYFDQAIDIAESSSPDDTELNQLKNLLSEYEAIEKSREAKRLQRYDKYLEELNEHKSKPVPDNPKDTDKAVATVVRLREYSTENQKELVLFDPFVKELIEKVKSNADSFEKEGKWSDAFSHGYHWLTELYPDNKSYDTHAELLIELASIEGSLKDNSCIKAIEQYRGIKTDMFLRAIGALSFKYVEPVDYKQMGQKALQRCRLIGKVLANNDGKLICKVSDDQVKMWMLGIETIEAQTESSSAGATRDIYIRLFDEIMALNQITINIPEEIMIAHFTESSFDALDPYTNLIWPEKIKEFQKSIKQEFTGIGIRMRKLGNSLKVISLIPNSPAFSSGLDAGDVIVAVDGQSTEDMSSDCAVRKISGPKGTKVVLTVKHEDSEETADITIVRDKITVPTIYGQKRNNGDSDKNKWNHMVDPLNGIGYVRISNFVDKTAENLEQIVSELEQDGLKGLILDLRGNTGGLLISAVNIVDKFVSKGIILKSQPRLMVPSLWTAHEDNTHSDYPIVILINNSSASASEIVAGALQDKLHKRALIVGSRSYGKGSVQEITDFTGNGSQFKFTTAFYYLPSGQPVKNRYLVKKQGGNDWGITPDIEVKLRPNEIEEMYKLKNANETVAKDNSGSSEYSISQTLESDPQLATALIAIKSKLISEGKTISFEIAAETQQEKKDKQEVR